MRGFKWLTGRAQQASQLTERRSPGRESDEGWHPVQTGSMLLQTDEHRRLIRVLAENSPLSKQATEAWWLQPLDALAVRVQTCPAAWQGAFSGERGFTELSLTVATASVRLVRGMMLPPGATPEAQAEQTSGWLCAAYWAGLFHHLPWLIQVEGALKNGGVWYPGLSTPGEAWRVRPAGVVSPGEMNSAYVAFRLLPESALLWLQRWPEVSGTLLLFLAGRRAEAGILNSIVNDARRSCGIVDTAGTDTPAADFPSCAAPASDNTTPTLYEADANPLSSLDNISSSSASMDSGNVTYSLDPDAKNVGDVVADTVMPAPSAPLESAFSSETPLYSAEGDDATGGEGERPVSTASLLSMLDLMAEGKTATVGEDTLTEQHEARDFPAEIPSVTGHLSGNGQQVGELFLEWVRDSVEDGTLSVNEKDSLVHVLAQFVFLVSPGCFYRYAATSGGNGADKDKLQKSFEALNIHHSRNGRGVFHYHQYDTPDKGGRFTKVSGYMINADIILKKGSCPPDSLWLSAKK